MQQRIITPHQTITTPGIYDIDNETYHSGYGISRTGIVEFMKSPLHYWERYINPNRKPVYSTKEMAFGSAFHMLILEPDLFKKSVAIVPNIDKRTTAGKAAWAMHQAESYGKIILEDIDYQALLNMYDRVMGNTSARALIENGQYERSIYYIDQASQTLCKSRPDILHQNYTTDLKTANDASMMGFKYDIVKYGYHIQAAMIFDGVEQVLKQKMDEFVFIVVEKTPPYAFAIHFLDLETIDIGRQIYRKKLIQIKECTSSNVWPSYESHVISLSNSLIH